MRLGFLILAHNDPAGLKRLTDHLVGQGGSVVIHFDRNGAPEALQEVLELERSYPGKVRVISEVRCRWGEWSLVEAVLRALAEFPKMGETPDYIHLMSGAEMPIRPMSELREFLARYPDLDFIECCDITRKPWVKGGLSIERLKFYFPFNFRTHRSLFDRLVRWQRKLHIRRRMPMNLTPHMGSQWWTMRWSTCQKVLDFTARHPEVPKFFRSTWIPDESYFPTLIAKLVPSWEIADLQLTFHHLTPAGRPYVFYNDHLPWLRRIPHFFVRKVSPQASMLWNADLGNLARGRRLPTPARLAKVRDLLRARIDASCSIKGVVPGYIPDPLKAPAIKIPHQAVLCLVRDHASLAACESAARNTPGVSWLGRPFAPKDVAMPDEVQASVGISAAGWKLRDAFPEDFLRQLLAVQGGHRLPLAAVWIGMDEPDLKALSNFPGLMPFYVRTGEQSAPHHESRTMGYFHDLNPAFQARIVTVDSHCLSSAIAAAAEDVGK